MTRVLTPAETENVSVTLFVNKTMSCHAIIMIDMLDFSSMVYCQFYWKCSWTPRASWPRARFPRHCRWLVTSNPPGVEGSTSWPLMEGAQSKDPPVEDSVENLTVTLIHVPRLICTPLYSMRVNNFNQGKIIYYWKKLKHEIWSMSTTVRKLPLKYEMNAVWGINLERSFRPIKEH